MTIVVEGQEIETDYEGYMAYQRWKREQAEETRRRQEHDLRMKRLEVEIKKITAETGGVSKESEIPVKVGDQEIKVPASIAPLYMQRGEDKALKEMREKYEEEREERHKAELKKLEEAHKGETKRLDDKIEEMNKRPGFLEQLEHYRSAGGVLGMRQTGRTTLDVLDEIRGDVHTTAKSLMNKIPTLEGEFKPEVSRTPEERRKKAEEIKRRLEKSKEILEAEDDLIKAASRLKD